ncbi:MAG: hypothetical protein C0505_00765 [Leptothrix sp. (in: Bacteria)]|nr:hypothetical protein [Leptothrix sp. (in: b-proteobacteria)]
MSARQALCLGARAQRLLRLAAAALLGLAASAVQAQTCTTCSSVASGNWNATATWGGFTPATTATVTINNGHTVNLNVDATVARVYTNSGGTLTGTVGAAKTLTINGGTDPDVRNNGAIEFQVRSGGATLPLGYIRLSSASLQWSGSGVWNLYSIDIVNRSLSFATGTAATIQLGGPTPLTRTTGTVTAQVGMTFNFNGLGNQAIPSTGFALQHIRTSGSGTKTVTTALPATSVGTVTAAKGITIEAGTTWDGATNNPIVNVGGNLSIAGTFRAGNGLYSFNGTTAQVLSDVNETVIPRMTMNNLSGLSLSRTLRVTTQLTLTRGQLTNQGTGVEVFVDANYVSSTVPLSRSTTLANKAWVVGNLRRRVTNSTAFNFDVGDATTYRPITAVAFASVTSPFSVTASASTVAGDHPNLASSGVNPARSINRYWTLTNRGPGSPFTSYTATFTNVAGDVDSGADTANFIAVRRDGGSWTRETVNSNTATTRRVINATGFGDFAFGSANVDHYELSLPSRSLACQASTVTLIACTDASSPCTSPANFVAGQTATLAAGGGATLGATSVAFDAAGVARTTLSQPAATDGAVSTVTLAGESLPAAQSRRCCPDGASCVTANSCSTTFSTAGFILSGSAGGAATTLPTQTAGTASAGFVLRAVKTSTTTQACEAALSGAATVDWALRCSNPTTCSAGNLMTVTGSSAVAVSSTSNAVPSVYTSVPMSFDTNGNAPFSFNYANVGLVSLYVRKLAGGPLLASLAVASNSFVVRPAGFVISGVKQTAAPQLANPAAAGAAGAKFVAAGEAFGATVTAVTRSGAAAPNFGNETTREGVLLRPTLVAPAGGAAGTLANATVAGTAFSAGAASVSNLSFSEVGIVTLTPSVADGDYLGAGNVTGTTTGNIGRFVPAKFALSAGSVTHRSGLACAPASAFSHLGENFRLGFTLTAQNLAGATTTNYRGSFAKLDPAAAAGWNLVGMDGSTVFSAASGRLTLGSATGSWSNGVAAGITLTANAARAAAADGPFNATFGIAPMDSDGVAITAYDLDTDSPANGADHAAVAAVALRFGRLRLANAIGAADRPLNLPVTAQYWNGTSFATNTLDSCTTVPATAVSLGNLRRTLTAADTAVASPVAVSGGLGALRLAAPAGGHRGTLDVALSLGSAAADASCLQPWSPGSGDAATAGVNLAFLRGAWCGSAYDKDPAARASFGLQRGHDGLIYRRENY